MSAKSLIGIPLIYFFFNFSNNALMAQYIIDYGKGISLNTYRTDLAISATGQVFIAYEDRAMKGKLSVKLFNGKRWEDLGERGISKKPVKDFYITVNDDNVPCVYYRENSECRKVIAKKFENNQWVNFKCSESDIMQNIKSGTLETVKNNMVMVYGKSVDLSTVDRQSASDGEDLKFSHSSLINMMSLMNKKYCVMVNQTDYGNTILIKKMDF
ncbi:MAG: hypothetical protein ACK40G_09490 [Cytophagaceae bacterium]